MTCEVDHRIPSTRFGRERTAECDSLISRSGGAVLRVQEEAQDHRADESCSTPHSETDWTVRDGSFR